MVEKQFLKITKNPVLKNKMIEGAGKEDDVTAVSNIFGNSRSVTG